MNNTPFLKKYCPTKLVDIELNENSKEIIFSLIKLDNLNILFVGNTGCGKTTLLNVIVNEYYTEDTDIDVKYEDNILHINSLNEYGINFFRNEVKTFCQIPSKINNKKKIIILDDLDSINEQSQQIFRNFIDKYSHNVFFLASCLNLQKITDSIQSRFNIIKMSSISNVSLLKIFEKIRKNEGISIEPNIDKFIIKLCNNSIRLLLNYMEKFKILNETITLSVAKNICSNISFQDFNNYITKLYVKHDLMKGIIIMNNIYNKGYSVIDILDNFFIFIKHCQTIDDDLKYKIIEIICRYITIFHTKHEHEIELSLFTYDLYKCKIV
uniref:AAA+ ATPase domain-containing protein n=1 Tax=viral metagenome TaxID=1070528 RepID=A0A6C0KE98_9ZZZZ